MKKIVAIAFIGGLILASCAKKETSTESNVMLNEPETATMDNVVVDSATTPVVVDSVNIQ